MAKVNPWALRRPERRIETRTFTDPVQPGQEITLTLRALDPCERTFAHERADYYTELYVTGRDGQEPNMYPAPDGTPIKLSSRMCYNICFVEQMQVAEDPQDRYTFDELLGISLTLPNAWDQIMIWVAGFLNPEDSYVGNSQGATTAES